MKSIAFIDIEVNPESESILNIGGIKSDGSIFHKNSIPEFVQFLKGTHFLCGHNILRHDLKYLEKGIRESGLDHSHCIDTLFLSPLLFPAKPYHALLKDEKLQTEEINNPLNDSKKAKDLFFDEVAAFHQLPGELKALYYFLLKDTKEFGGFFRYLEISGQSFPLENSIRKMFEGKICQNANFGRFVQEHPVELAYSLALIQVNDRYSITPPWVSRGFPEVGRIIQVLRNTPCLYGCKYCDEALNIFKGLKRCFGFDSFRSYGGIPLQENAVQAAVEGKSILAVFPTGGGKSITFQLPALMSGENEKGLTVVISPLQSLMKDQVDNLEKIQITEAVTINGLLDPVERAKSIQRVEEGFASLLYISPESLRSKTIERLLLGRNVVRFVIDEAHCFSSWGHDFRVDYLYIGEFIRHYQEMKSLREGIPISCFTATAKQKVIEDICQYFLEELDLKLQIFKSSVSRPNLRYKVREEQGEEEKYRTLRNLIEERNCPTIVYVSRTRKASELSQRLVLDGFSARPYHGKMPAEEKTANQNAFIQGEVSIMVATSAFGMGVDKKDVGKVIHYEISDSLENYVQEAGRAGRDEHITADCHVLFNEDDLGKHFILLNQTRLTQKEIQQVWKAIKDLTKFRSTISNSALEIARLAGWDDSVAEIETRVTTAIAALENSGYLKRGQNMPRVYANSILCRNMEEARVKIEASDKFFPMQKEKAIRIMKKLFSSKSRLQRSEEIPEARVDYISDHLGIVKEDVIQIINILREEKILADAKDLTAFINRGDSKQKSSRIRLNYVRMEEYLLSVLKNSEIVNIKELNEGAIAAGLEDVTTKIIKILFNLWAIKNWIKRSDFNYESNHFRLEFIVSKNEIALKIKKRKKLSEFILDFLFDISFQNQSQSDLATDVVRVEFSVLGLKNAFENSILSFGEKAELAEVEDALFFLSRIEAIKIEGGFLVVYNRLSIERMEMDNKRRYKVEDYQHLKQYYDNKIQQIHIVGEYAKMMLEDYRKALQFVEDYFQLNYPVFLNKYFKGDRQGEININITPAKFRQLFGDLSTTQLKVIKETESKIIVVAAGPGSGKTKVLVHKLASLLMLEEVKHEQLLMLTFSRAAAMEFRKRLNQLVGGAIRFVEMKTFHSFCFDLLGRVGSLEKSDNILEQTIDKINAGEVETGRITKAVLVIDEAQDMNRNEFHLVKTLMKLNEDIRVIAVGDDDQNIFEFRGSQSEHLHELLHMDNSVKFELLENFRSKPNLVDFANEFLKCIPDRIKQNPLIGKNSGTGKINIVQYSGTKLITPLVRDILSSDLSGSTGVLTTSNEEASFVTGMLLKAGMPARLIQSNDGFSLLNLQELRYLLGVWKEEKGGLARDGEDWRMAKAGMEKRFNRSSKLGLVKRIISDFEEEYSGVIFKTDFEIFLRDSKLEEFYQDSQETLLVSTIHKSKGREFDNVFLLLDNFELNSNERKRQLYVGITRAKQNLVIHYNRNYFDSITVPNLSRKWVDDSFDGPDELVFQLSFKDVWLDSFLNSQKLIASFQSGDLLEVKGQTCYDTSGRVLFRFSKKFMEKAEKLNSANYVLQKAVVNFVVYWQKEGEEKEIAVILPEVVFVRK